MWMINFSPRPSPGNRLQSYQSGVEVRDGVLRKNTKIAAEKHKPIKLAFSTRHKSDHRLVSAGPGMSGHVGRLPGCILAFRFQGADDR